MTCFTAVLAIAMGGLGARSSVRGEAIFNSNCAPCHGRDGTGGRGPSLLDLLRKGTLDSQIETVVRNGGTTMPKFNFEVDELQVLLYYIHSLRGAPLSGRPQDGDVAAGKRLYSFEGCATCHSIANEGSAFGPDLTRIGSSRSYEYLKTSILNPSADILEQNHAITIETRSGKLYRGLWVNEDSFTVQIRLPDESFASFDKQELRLETHEKESLMPAYSFNAPDLRNLLAYLSSLGRDSSGTSRAQSGRQH